jgi:hypothetical protein
LISGALPRNQGIEYKEVPINSSIIRFAFAVEFAESPQQFGGANLSFSNKKDAKQWAAKKALDWLIGNNCMASTGKRTIDAEALEAKKAAREEIGNNNWVGKLLGLLIPPKHLLSLLTMSRIPQCTSSHSAIQSCTKWSTPWA